MLWVRRLCACVLATALLPSCDAPAGTSTEPTQPEIAGASGPSERGSMTPVAVPKPTTPIGWWRSDTVCLELFVNGDFELALPDATPKVLMMGSASLLAKEPGAFTVELAVERIWKARFTGPCRRTHELGEWAESQSVLGKTFRPKATDSLELRRLPDGGIELCGSECATLRPDTPALGGTWAYDLFQSTKPPPLAVGDLVRIAIDQDGFMSSLWVAKDATSWDSPLGEMAVESLGDDRFTLTFTPRPDS